MVSLLDIQPSAQELTVTRDAGARNRVPVSAGGASACCTLLPCGPASQERCRPALPAAGWQRRRLALVPVELTRADHERLADVCRRFGVSRLDVFGSVSRGDDRDESDVDLLYELAPDAELGWEIEDLAAELERLLGRPVDLVSKRALHPALRDAVLGEARPLYAA